MRGVTKIAVTILTNNKWVGKVVPKQQTLYTQNIGAYHDF